MEISWEASICFSHGFNDSLYSTRDLQGRVGSVVFLGINEEFSAEIYYLLEILRYCDDIGIQLRMDCQYLDEIG
jgi:hypothetical protein